MRKLICSVLVLVVLMTTGIPAVMAAHHGKKVKGPNQKCGNAKQTACLRTDEDQNDICVNGSRKGLICGQRVDEDGDGICDNRDQKTSVCKNGVDEDGVCDYRENKYGYKRNCQNKVNKKCQRK